MIFLQKANFKKRQKFLKFNFDLRKNYLFVIEEYSFYFVKDSYAAF